MQYADRAEVFLLNFTPVAEIPNGEDIEYFPIRPYSEILDRKMLTDESLAQCRQAVSALLQEQYDLESGLFCHFPVHGVRLYRGEEVIFETSVCWKCINYYIMYPLSEVESWVGFSGGPLRKLLMAEMPIPKAEMERFQVKYGRIKKKWKAQD